MQWQHADVDSCCLLFAVSGALGRKVAERALDLAKLSAFDVEQVEISSLKMSLALARRSIPIVLGKAASCFLLRVSTIVDSFIFSSREKEISAEYLSPSLESLVASRPLDMEGDFFFPSIMMEGRSWVGGNQR